MDQIWMFYPFAQKAKLYYSALCFNLQQIFLKFLSNFNALFSCFFKLVSDVCGAVSSAKCGLLHFL